MARPYGLGVHGRRPQHILLQTRQVTPSSQEALQHPLARRKRIAGLDLGTSKVAAVIGEIDEYGHLNVLGVGEVASDGLRKGVVVNIDRTVSAVNAAVLAAERMAGIRVESVVVSLAGTHICSQNSRGVIAVSRADREIAPADVSRVVEAARAVGIASDRQVTQPIPRA